MSPRDWSPDNFRLLAAVGARPRPVAMGPKAAPGLESEYKPRLPAGSPPGARSSLLIKRSWLRRTVASPGIH